MARRPSKTEEFRPLFRKLAEEQQEQKPRERSACRASGLQLEPNRSSGSPAARAPLPSGNSSLLTSSMQGNAPIDGFLDPDKAGDFHLHQDNYVRPNFPPLSTSWKPPTPFPEALYGIPQPSRTIDHADKCEASSSSFK